MSEPSSRRRIVFQRGGALYSAIVSSDGISAGRHCVDKDRLLPGGWDGDWIWAVSPDGRKIAWLGPTDRTGIPRRERMADPTTVYVASWPDLRYRRELFTTARLRDARGRSVTQFPLDGDAFEQFQMQEQDPEIDGMWALENLRWSRSGERLYVRTGIISPSAPTTTGGSG